MTTVYVLICTARYTMTFVYEASVTCWLGLASNTNSGVWADTHRQGVTAAQTRRYRACGYHLLEESEAGPEGGVPRGYARLVPTGCPSC